MRYIPLLFLCLFLQACTQTQKGLTDTVELALLGPDDVEVTSQQVENLPYASMYLRLNDGQRIFVVLGFDENGQQKWITRDRSVVVTQHGRVVKTLGLRDNLSGVTNMQQDPLSDPLHIKEGATWTSTQSWTEAGKFRSATAVSHFTRAEDRVLDLAGKKIPCRVWLEQVSLPAIGKSWTNTFWFDTTTGQVRQSQQQLGGADFSLETIILKPAKS
ncbi:YjbF family lipoprotein [Erwinia psidii]|uniref:YjbF family lipoprotein n=1 Tax=Erwinia psidii TaxID=69224 RepID=A0A3N6TMR8_9GAMM|nr:YjbF family lipoprotein [Erwinia psidii]MCX8958814.1 YjbF family lipoprotein [Erwinia psidii]MCX8963306.1 YjbF family lipoprotein [Erwinia psidii]MCX8965964.1 YjbF family lipoprotein [Erwinia psidii]RQM36522.1 YjbF family lipoprotein [Erwinia psidii]